MNEPMTLARFQELADAYGGVVDRWPDHLRDDAARTASQPVAATILARALALDDALDTWAVPVPGGSLRERVVSSAPAARRSLAVRARLWWSGIGIAAALAGAASGTSAVAMAPPVDTSPDSGTSFGDVDSQDN